MAKGFSARLSSQDGFVLVTAIMLLFVAMILGLMVMDSSDVEVMLSGAQQRYEDSLNTTEGGTGIEAAAVRTGSVIFRGTGSRSYVVVDTADTDKVLSPVDSTSDIFDPGNDMPDPDTPYTVDTTTSPDQWPMDNLLHSDDAADDRFDYHYRVVYLREDAPPEGYDATQFFGYLFKVEAKRETLVEMGATKIGLKNQ